MVELISAILERQIQNYGAVTDAECSLKFFHRRSRKEGFGIYLDGKWVAGRWPEKFLQNPIQWKELFPIHLACAIWAPFFSKKRLEFHWDNQAVVDIWASNTTKSKEIMPILR